jgi:hypothetical protein
MEALTPVIHAALDASPAGSIPSAAQATSVSIEARRGKIRAIIEVLLWQYVVP